MRKVLTSIIDGVSYLFIGGDEREHDAIPFKEKLKIVIDWAIVIIFCIIMLKLFI